MNKVRINFERSLLFPIIGICTLLSTSCSITKKVAEGESVLMKNNIVFLNSSEKEKVADLDKYIKQSAQKSFLGFNTKVAMYNISDNMGNPPVLYDKNQTKSTVTNLKNHLEYLGYYKSYVVDSVSTKNKKTEVDYLIKLGKSYIIDSINYSAPSPATLAILLDNQKESYIKKNDILAEKVLEDETKRLEKIFNNLGYFELSKNHFFFLADTIAKNGKANLYVELKDYTRSQNPEDAVEHKVYHFATPVVTTIRSFQSGRRTQLEDSVQNFRRDSLLTIWRSNVDTIKYGNLNIIQRSRIPLVRNSFLDRINLIKEDELYNTTVIEDTYSRFSSLSLFSSVSVEASGDEKGRVVPYINLQAGTLQGFKAKLEGSVNSNGLFGISPEISYYHKNLFKGAEVFTLSVSTDFQTKTKSDVHSQEVGIIATLDIPKFLFAPKRWFRSGVLPHTEFSLSYNFQKRPEYERNILSASYSYTWNFAKKFFFKASPLKANIVKLYNLDPDFIAKNSDPFIKYLYQNHFDLGSGFNFYYTTDPSLNPSKSFFYVRFQSDLAGNIVALFNGSLKKNEDGERLIWKSPYAQYFRVEGSTAYTFKYNGGKNALAVRLLAGVGKGYGNSKVLPVEKLFWGGGAYGLRGWQARTLGPGTAPQDTTYKLPSQLGDIKLEANIEYRFPLFWLLNGAVFVDAGNIWNFNRKVKNDQGQDVNIDERGVFKFDKFYKELALDWGVGLRLDITFVILRLDFGFKTYDPEFSKWVPAKNWFKNDNFQITFGVGYPF